MLRGGTLSRFWALSVWNVISQLPFGNAAVMCPSTVFNQHIARVVHVFRSPRTVHQAAGFRTHPGNFRFFVLIDDEPDPQTLPALARGLEQRVQV